MTKPKWKTFASSELGWVILFAKNRMPIVDVAGTLSSMEDGLLLFFEMAGYRIVLGDR